MVDKVIAGLPPAQPDRPAAEWTYNELLVDGAFGLPCIRELISRSMDEAAEGTKVRPIWEQRLIFDAASTLAKLLANVEMEAMRRKPDDAQISALWAAADAFERQLYGPTKATAGGPEGDGC